MPKPMTRMIFSADTLPPLTSEPPCEPWHILIVDDEPSVHDVTRLTLNRLELFGQPVKLHSAFSAAEARHLLESDTQYCLAFVDVVMETPMPVWS
jgi:CheY-like chemotaxis protein